MIWHSKNVLQGLPLVTYIYKKDQTVDHTYSEGTKGDKNLELSKKSV